MRATRFIKETATLRDDRKVVLRPIRPEDAPRLVELHQRLSTDSQYLRFFGPKPELSEEEAEFLANVDHLTRFAIVGTVEEDEREQVVAVGRFDIVSPGVAEPAIVVRDDYQGSGLGSTILLRMLEVARGRGVDTFQGEVLAENTRMLEILARNGLEISAPEEGVVRVTAPVTDTPLGLRALNLVAKATVVLAEHGSSLKRRDQSS